MYQCPPVCNFNGMPLTPKSISPTSMRDYIPKETMMESSDNLTSSEFVNDYPQEITWLFFRDNQWVPFQYSNHLKIEQAFTLGGIYVDIKDFNFPHLKSIRVFPTRMYLSYLGMKYRLSCIIQG